MHVLQNDREHKHAHGDHSVNLSHVLCVEPTSEKQIQEDFDSANPDTAWNIAGLDHRHQDCQKPQPAQKETKRSPPPNQLSLAILRSCRQVYFEANMVPYTNNTFAIGCNDILERFARARSQNKQNLLVRSLYLYFSIAHGTDVAAWSHSVHNAVLKRLTSVRCLNLTLGQFYCPCSMDMCGYEGTEMTERQRNMLKKFSKLPLREATLVIDDEIFLSHRGWDHYAELEQEYRWTLKQKQDFSKEIREALLVGGGRKKAK